MSAESIHAQEHPAPCAYDLMQGFASACPLEIAMREDEQRERTERFDDRDAWTPALSNSQKHAAARCARLTPKGPA